MASWRQEYLQCLQERNKRDMAVYELVDAYTKLADRTTVLEANADKSQPPSASPSTSRNATASSSDADLAEALRARSHLQSRLKLVEDELLELRTQSGVNSKTIRELSAEKSKLKRKVKDRDEELHGKAGLLVQVQDENMSLNLQLNMAEQQSNKLKKENKDLIDRWMAHKSKEADAMNNASSF